MGITLIEELPFAHAVSNKYMQIICSNCMKSASERGIVGKLNRCSACNLVCYCDKDCQKSDWINHKPECAFLLRRSPQLPNAFARLMGRVMTKLRHDGDMKPAFNGRLFASLMANVPEVGADPMKRKIFFVYRQILKDYLPEMPSSRLYEIFCKLMINGFSVADNHMNVTGAAVYLGLSVLDHSCNPDAFILFDGKKALLRTINDNIKKYSNKLRISYCDMMEPGPFRRFILHKQHYFTCHCELCQDEENDRQKYSLRCTKCNDGFCPYSPGEKNPEIRCKVCGEKSDYDLDDVQKLHKRLVDRERPQICSCAEQIFGKKSMEASVNELNELVDFYRECCVVFSPYNIMLHKLAKDIMNLAKLCKKYDEAVEYGAKTLLCPRTYLPKGHPYISFRVYSYGALLMDRGNPQCKPMLKEAFDLARESHGEENALTQEIAKRLEKLNNSGTN